MRCFLKSVGSYLGAPSISRSRNGDLSSLRGSGALWHALIWGVSRHPFISLFFIIFVEPGRVYVVLLPLRGAG